MGTRKNQRKFRKDKEREQRVKKDLARQREKRRRIPRLKRNYTSVEMGKIASLPKTERDWTIKRIIADEKLRKPLVGVPFPHSFAACAQKRSPIQSPNLRMALSLTAGILKAYQPRTLEAYRLVDNFYSELVSHQVEKANSILDQVRKRFGVSLWLIEATLLINELTEGVEGNRRFLSQIYNENAHQRVSMISTLKSQRVEEELPARSYCGSVNGLIEDGRQNDVDERELAEILFNLDFHTAPVQEHLSFVLDHSRAYSLLDTAIAYRCILPFYASNDNSSDSLQQRLDTIVDGEELIGSDQATLLREWIGRNEPPFASDFTRQHFRIESALMEGRFRDARELAKESMLRFPTCFEFYVAYAQACVLGKLDIVNPFPIDSIASRVLRSVTSAESYDDNTERSLNDLAKISYCLGNTQFAHRIMAYWLLKLNYASHFENFWLTCLPTVLPLICVNMSQTQRETFVERWLRAMNTPWLAHLTSVGDRSSEKTTASEDSGIEPRFALWFDAILDKENSLARYEQLRATTDSPFFLSKAFNAILRYSFKANDVVRIFNEIAHAFVFRPSFLIGYPMRMLGKFVRTAPSIASADGLKDFSWPISYWLATRDSLSETDEYHLWVAVDDFMAKNDCRTLGEYLTTGPEATPSLLCFLMHVCSTNVIRRNYKLKKRDQQHGERIHILQFVLKHDDGRYCQHARDEITEITKKDLLQDAIKDVDLGKIFVNTEGFAPKLSGENSQRFDRFDRLRRVPNSDMRKTMELTGVQIQRPRAVVFTDYSLKLLRDLVEEIRNEFVNNKSHGLNTYMSVHIRHGYISSQIRGQFATKALATRQQPDGTYQDNHFWLEKFSCLSRGNAKLANERMKLFSQQLDDLVEEVNSSWIRIRDSDHPTGMLDFDIADDELTVLNVLANKATDHLEFVDFVIDYLWTRTERLLSGIRDRIKGELLTRALQILHDLEHDILNICQEVSETDFSASVASCRNDVQADFHLFAEWFRRSSGHVVSDFTLDLVLDVATKTARQFHPGVDFLLDRQIVPQRFQGSWLKPFVEIMVILFDNLIKNSCTEQHRPKCVITFDGAHTLSVLVENDLGPSVDINQLRAKVATLNDESNLADLDGEKLQSEGNSGIAKIRKLVKEDLRQRSSSVSCSVPNNSTFCVLIEMRSMKVLRTDNEVTHS